jgi:nicotinamide mononucleotide transporter
MLQISWTEAIGSLTGLVSVWLTVRNNVWCWLWGIVSVLVYVAVFWEARLYADMALQLVFVGMNLFGWYEWLRPNANINANASANAIKDVGTFSLHYTLRQAQGEDRINPHAEPVEASSTIIAHVLTNEQSAKRRISSIPREELLLSLVSGVIAGIALSIFLKRFTNAAVPEMDAALTALSLVAVWMQARKYRENWLVWLLADVFYVGLFFNRQLWLTSALYLVFCGMAVLGWREWNHQIQKENALEHR